MHTQPSSAAFRRHPFFSTPKDEQRDAFRDEVARIVTNTTKIVRHGVRVLANGTVQHYAVA